MFDYAIIDKDGNSPLLQAVAPKNSEERKNALQTIQECLKATTLIIEKISSNKRPRYFTELNRATTYEEISIGCDPDIIFGLLQTTRYKFATTLKNMLLAGDVSFAEKVAHEILVQFASKELPPNTDRADKLLKDYANAKRQYNYNENILSIDVIKDTSTIQQFGKIAVVWSEVAYNSLLNYCKEQFTILYYINMIASSRLAVGYSSLVKYASEAKVAIQIWSIVNGNNLKLLQRYDPLLPAQNPVLNLLALDFKTFNLLRPISKPRSLLESYSLRLKKLFEPLNEINTRGENLLHRAAANISANIVVPYLLTVLGFGTQVDKTDYLGETALHKAIRYFAMHKEELKSKYNETDESLFHIAMSCFSYLISAGANLQIKNYQHHSPLDFALHYESCYLIKNGDTTLRELLIEEQSKFPVKTLKNQNRMVTTVIPLAFFKGNILRNSFLEQHAVDNAEQKQEVDKLFAQKLY